MARSFQGIDGIGEGRRRRIGGDGLNLGTMLAERAIKGSAEMLRPDRAERGNAERRGPGGEEGIVEELCHRTYVPLRDAVGKGSR